MMHNRSPLNSNSWGLTTIIIYFLFPVVSVGHEFRPSLARCSWLEVSQMVAVRRHLDCGHLATHLGLDDLIPRWLAHLAGKDLGGKFQVLSV